MKAVQKCKQASNIISLKLSEATMWVSCILTSLCHGDYASMNLVNYHLTPRRTCCSFKHISPLSYFFMLLLAGWLHYY